MKKKLLCLACGLLLLAPQIAQAVSAPVAVGDAPACAQPATSKHSADYIKIRLQLIYTLVFNSIETGRTSISEYFFSDELRAIYRAAEEVTPEGEVGYYDFDPWLRAQDYCDPQAVVESVHDIGMNAAVADVIVYPKGRDKAGVSVRVSLRYERGDWFIANFDDDLDGLKSYINSH